MDVPAPVSVPGFAKPTVVLSPSTLPAGGNVNPYCYCVQLDGEWFLSKGAMIAYYGQMRFEGLSAMASVNSFVATQFSSPLYVHDWVVATGTGQLLLGDRGFDINSYDLDDGNLTIKSSNLLGFSPALALKQSIIPGYLTLLGTGTFLASSNGPVIFMEPPLRADPQALLGWADCPSPCHHHDAVWMNSLLGAAQGFFGRASGEERQLDFIGAGTVLLQSSEIEREDPAVLALVEEQTRSLTQSQLSTLHSRIGAQLQQQ